MPLVHRELLGHPQRLPGGQDGDLGDRVAVGRQRRDQRVAALVDRDRALLVGQQRVGRLPPPQQDPVARLGEVRGAQHVAAAADRVDRRLVDQVGQVGAGEPGGAAGDHVQVDVGAELLPVGVDLQDRLALALGRQRDDHLTVEAAGSQQRRVEHLGPVGGRHHHHAGGGIEAVHLRQHLVERLVALVVGDHLAATALADGVDLVDEDDRRGALSGVVEQVADPGGADPHEHLHERRPGHRDERHAGLAGDRAGDQGLAGAWRADHEHALGAHRPGAPVAVGVLEEVDHLGDFALDALVAGHVRKRRARPVGVVDAAAGAAHAADGAELAPGGASEVDEEPHEQQQRQQAHQDGDEGALRPDRCDLDVVLLQQRGELGVLQVHRVRGLELGPVRQHAVDVPVAADLDRLDLSGRDLVLELGLVGERLNLAAAHAAGEQQDPEGDGHADPRQPHPPPGRRGRGRRPRPLGWRPRLGLVAQVHPRVQTLRHRLCSSQTGRLHGPR